MTKPFNPDLLINQATGEIDQAYVASGAEICAREHWGEACTASDVSYYAEKLSGRAFILRNRRRRELGLPDDTVYVTVTPFGRQAEGVRRSAF
jgi:hypothetical protein